MSKKTEEAAQKVSELISELSMPEAMTVEEAREFYTDIREHVEVMLEALGG